MLNLPFELQKNNRVRENGALQPYEIVSLWEVIKIFGNHFFGFCGYLVILARMSENAHCQGIARVDFEAISSMRQFRYQYGNYPEILKIMGLTHSVPRCERLMQLIDESKTTTVAHQDLRESLDNLFVSLIDELEGILMFVVPDSGNAKFFQAQNTFLGLQIIDKFPSLAEDADEAGNCFAVGRYTACVFHLMRIVETLVQELGIKTQAKNKTGELIDVKNEDWYQIEKAIHKAVNLENMPKSEEKETLGKVLQALNTVRIGWRNPTMHPKQTYTENEARFLLNAVKSFAELLIFLL